MTNETENDPLAFLSTPACELKEPTFPLLKPDKIYRMVIRSSELNEAREPNEKTGIKSLMWVLKLQTTKEEISTEDQIIYPGATVFHRFNITPTDERPAKRIEEEAGMAVKAVYGAGTQLKIRDCIKDSSLMLDKLVDVKIGIKKANDPWPASNNVKNWVVPPA